MSDKWYKILSDLEHKSSLSPHQYFWKILSYIRINKIQEAENTFFSTRPHTQSETRFQLLYIEILIKKKLKRDAITNLLSLHHKCKDQQSLNSWLILAKRLKQYDPRIQNFIEQSNDTEHQIPNLQRQKDWEQLLSLPRYQSNDKAYFAYLNWQVKQSPFSPEKIKSILNLILKYLRLTPFQYYQIFDLLSKYEDLWPYMIENIFAKATPSQIDPKKMWSMWHKHCPTSLKKSLIQQMKNYLLKKPNLELENLLIKLR